MSPVVAGAFRSASSTSLLGSSATPANVFGGPFFLKGTQAHLYDTAAALCSRIIPTDTNLVTGAVASPGATEANAVQFIDMFLAAFELPSTVAQNPAIYLKGRFSGRDPYAPADPDSPLANFGNFPTDELENTSGQRQFLGLSPQQAIAWYLRLYGTLSGLPSSFTSTFSPSSKWVSQVTGSSPTIPGVIGPTGLRGLYVSGLQSFDSWSKQNFGTPFASANPLEQEALVVIASNVLIEGIAGAGFPSLPAPVPDPLPPAAAAALFPILALHTIQGCYCMPEYGGNGGTMSPKAKPVTWPSIGWDGDTMPLGNSLYDDSAYGPGQGPNAGFGDPNVFQPRGTYVEYRPVSTLAADSDTCTVAELSELIAHLAKLANVKVLG